MNGTACDQRRVRVRLRPHHFLCIRGFGGRGYSEEFVENLERVLRSLREPGFEVEVVKGADDICAACPFLSGGRCLKGEEKSSEIDERAAERLGLQYGDVAVFSEIEKALLAIDPGEIAVLCRDCQWLEFGYCIEAYRKRKNQKR